MIHVNGSIYNFREEIIKFRSLNQNAQKTIEHLKTLDNKLATLASLSDALVNFQNKLEDFKKTSDEIIDLMEDLNKNLNGYDLFNDKWKKLQAIIIDAFDKTSILLFFKSYTQYGHIELTKSSPPTKYDIYSSFSHLPIRDSLTYSNFALLVNGPSTNSYHFCVIANPTDTCFKNVKYPQEGGLTFELISNRKSENCATNSCLKTSDSISLLFSVNKDQTFKVKEYEHRIIKDEFKPISPSP